jgi:hypothetical protein
MIIKSSRIVSKFEKSRQSLLGKWAVYASAVYVMLSFQHSAEAINGDKRIYIIEEFISDNDIDALHHRCDCYVSLHRSEG